MGGGNCCHPQNPKSSLRGEGGLWDPQQGQSLSQGWRMTPLWSVCRDTPGAPPLLDLGTPRPHCNHPMGISGISPHPPLNTTHLGCPLQNGVTACCNLHPPLPPPPPVVPRTEKQQVGGGGGGSQTPALLLAQISKHRGGTAHPAVSIIPPHPPSPPPALFVSPGPTLAPYRGGDGGPHP